MTSFSLRRPWAKMADCMWLARLVDKTRHHLSGQLPQEFRLPLYHPLATDGAFLAHFSLAKEELLEVVQRHEGQDEKVAAWFRSRVDGAGDLIIRWNDLAPHLGKPGYPVHAGFLRMRRLQFGAAPFDPRIDSVFALLAHDEGAWEEWLAQAGGVRG